MEVWKRFMRILSIVTVFALLILSCSSPFLKYEEPQGLNIDEGIPDVRVKEIGDDPNVNKMDLGAIPSAPGVKAVPPSEGPTPVPQPTPISSALKKKGKAKTQNAKKESIGSSSTLSTTGKLSDAPKAREPKYESSVGFTNGSRRPDKDPFRVGEKVVLSVRYFKAQAGELSMEVRPLVEVNDRKSYRWHTGLKTTGMFSKFYSIDDWAETLVDYETLSPTVFNLHVKESAQLRNGKGYFDPKTLKGVYIEKKYTEKKGHQEKRQEWQVLPYAQNVFSAAFYMRVFTFEVGKEFKFTVADDEKNMLFKGKTLRKEHVETEAGEFDTIVVKPEFEVDGVFKPVGDIFFWLTDDDRKLIVKIESEIKIGTLVMEAIQVDRGEE